MLLFHWIYDVEHTEDRAEAEDVVVVLDAAEVVGCSERKFSGLDVRLSLIGLTAKPV